MFVRRPWLSLVSSVDFFIRLSPLIPSGQLLSRLVGPMSADSPSLPHHPPAFFPATLVTDDPPPLRSPKASKFSSDIGGSSPPSSPFDRALSLHSRYQRSPLLLTIVCRRIEKSVNSCSIPPDPHPPHRSTALFLAPLVSNNVPLKIAPSWSIFVQCWWTLPTSLIV